jgi:hypothetical protein
VRYPDPAQIAYNGWGWVVGRRLKRLPVQTIPDAKYEKFSIPGIASDCDPPLVMRSSLIFCLFKILGANFEQQKFGFHPNFVPLPCHRAGLPQAGERSAIIFSVSFLNHLNAQLSPQPPLFSPFFFCHFTI